MSQTNQATLETYENGVISINLNNRRYNGRIVQSIPSGKSVVM
jgi:hypothetical protein